MDKHCDHNIPETKKGLGPCDINWEVKKRNGRPNWWCHTHGLGASAPDGAALPQCSGAWFTAVDAELQTDIDVCAGEVSVWGVTPPAIGIGRVPREKGKVHVHFRLPGAEDKEIDRSYDIVRLTAGSHSVTIEGMAAQAYAVSELSRMTTEPLACPHCHEVHIDELMFAATPHVKHLCNSCGRNFRDKSPSISNPLAHAQADLGLPSLPSPKQVKRPLNISSADYTGIALWPSNAAIVSTLTRTEDEGIHVHAWTAEGGRPVIDETHSPVTIDGVTIDEVALRVLAVQRALADGAPVVALECTSCQHSILSPTTGWMQPSTRHICNNCGVENRTRRKSFVNPLAGQL